MSCLLIIFAPNKRRTILNTFEELGIREDFVKGLNELSIITPTEIQQLAIPVLLAENTDLVGQAQTGTGKTAAYGLPLLHQINPKQKIVQGLILCPTRELGQQIAKQLFKYTKYTDKIFSEAVFGGPNISEQINRLKRPTHIVVATPGRLIDLVERKAVDLSHVHTVVLDEADEMLSMGFKKELDRILSFLSSAQNKWLFSATLPEGIKQIVKQHLSPHAHRIEISAKNVVNKNIDHQYLMVAEVEKLKELINALRKTGHQRALIFCKTKATAQRLEKQLQSRNIAAGAIHGDLLQKERDKVMRGFKNERIQFLVATDLAARGLDIPELQYVFHYQLPDKLEYYTHRSGRTARAGRNGVSLCFVTTGDMKQIRFFEKSLHIAFTQVR